ncbi:MAG: hypothetical protein HQK65_00305 [Desulfamplus sp.]|nr:hypothetical protein [Desulfamplus sp.]
MNINIETLILLFVALFLIIAFVFWITKKRKVHNILLIGKTGAGKTAFMTKIINPNTTQADFAQIESTSKELLVVDPRLKYVGVNPGNDVSHCLKFWDTSGESSSTIEDHLKTLSAQNEKCIALIIRPLLSKLEQDYIELLEDLACATKRKDAQTKNDLEQRKTELEQELNDAVNRGGSETTKELLTTSYYDYARLEHIFNQNDVKEIITDIIVFLNKSDKLNDDQLCDLKSIEEEIKDNLNLIPGITGKLRYIGSGSVWEDKNIANFEGKIKEILGISDIINTKRSKLVSFILKLKKLRLPRIRLQW